MALAAVSNLAGGAMPGRADPPVSTSTAIIHFKPAGHFLGDVHPFFRDGECFLYYLMPGGGYESALVRSRNLFHWTEAPIKHDPLQPGQLTRPYYVLGVFRDPAAGVYRSFFSYKDGRILSSSSIDLLHWSCAPAPFGLPLSEGYTMRRDPFVFWIPEMHEYGCVMTSRLENRTADSASAVSCATSPDLQHWREHGPVLDPGHIADPECPQAFHLGDAWYLLVSVSDHGVGGPSYWRSPSATGPWPKGKTGMLDGRDVCAAQLGFDGETPVLFGWIPSCVSASEQPTWGGHLSLPRVVYARPDGTLGTRLHPGVGRLIRGAPLYAHEDAALTAQPVHLPGDWSFTNAEMTVDLPPASAGARISLDSPSGASAEIVIDRRRERLAIQTADGTIWARLSIAIGGETTLPLRVIVDGDIVEVFLLDRYSLAARLPQSVEHFSLTASAPDGPARLRNLRLWKLVPYGH